MLKRMLPEWRDLMRDVPYSVTGVAKEADMAADNVQRIMDGTSKNYGVLTAQRIKEAIERLRDVCPTCHRKGLQEAQRHERDRRTEKGRTKRETTG